MSDGVMRSKRHISTKIIIPILLLCVVVGIWIVKNHKKSSAYVDVILTFPYEEISYS